VNPCTANIFDNEFFMDVLLQPYIGSTELKKLSKELAVAVRASLVSNKFASNL
jgi:hypothetical protein